jgi:ABC-2 type transport system permease protein
MMLRPLGLLGQLATSDFALRRLGRTTQALGVLVIALFVVDVDWTPGRVLLLLVTPLCGAVIFASIFVATAAATFWLVEGGEFANAFTYGGNYLATWPMTVFDTVVRRFFTFVIPGAFVAYLPTLALLGRPDPNGMPAWASWSSPVAAAATAGVAAIVWRLGVRHYVGAGS